MVKSLLFWCPHPSAWEPEAQPGLEEWACWVFLQRQTHCPQKWCSFSGLLLKTWELCIWKVVTLEATGENKQISPPQEYHGVESIIRQMASVFLSFHLWYVVLKLKHPCRHTPHRLPSCYDIMLPSQLPSSFSTSSVRKASQIPTHESECLKGFSAHSEASICSTWYSVAIVMNIDLASGRKKKN